MTNPIIVLLICVTLHSMGQSIATDKIDEFDKTRIIRTKEYEGSMWKKKDFIDENNEFLLSMVFTRDKAGLEVYALSLQALTARDFGCLSQYDGKLMILFENDSTMELAQFSDTDCGAPFSALYILANRKDLKNPLITDIVRENFNMLLKTNVKKFRLFASKGYIDATLKPEKINTFALHAGLIRDKLK